MLLTFECALLPCGALLKAQPLSISIALPLLPAYY